MRRMANVQCNKTSEHSRSSLNRPEELSSRRRALHPRVPPARDHKHPPGRGDKGPFTGGASPRRSRRGRCAQQPPGLPPHRTTLEGRRGKQPHCTPFIINNKTRPPKSTPRKPPGLLPGWAGRERGACSRRRGRGPLGAAQIERCRHTADGFWSSRALCTFRDAVFFFLGDSGKRGGSDWAELPSAV